MPIVVVPVSADRTFPTPGARLAQRGRDLAVFGDPLADPEPSPRASGLFDTYTALLGTGLVQAATNAATRPFATEGVNPAFNPFEYIRSRPSLLANPRVADLVERGQFDGSLSQEQFEYDLATGLQYLEDAETVARSSRSAFWGAMAAGVVLDPTNLVPIGIGAKLFRTATLPGRIARTAGLAGGTALALEELRNSLQPATDDPGPENELVSAAMGAGIGAFVGWITSPAVLESGTKWVSTRKVRQIQRDLDRVAREPIATPIDPATVRTLDDLPKVTLGDEAERGRSYLLNVLGEEPVDNRVVSVLHREGDESSKLLEQLRAKYDAAGKTLRVVEHPDQHIMDLIADVRAIMDHPDLSSDATPADLDLGYLDAAMTALTSRYANFQSMATPGGRLATSTLSRLLDIHRTVAGSAQTIPVGSARDPRGFAAGAPAENLKSLLQAQKDEAVMGVRATYRKARREGRPVVYNGQTIRPRFGYRQFADAVHDYMRRQNARARGFAVDVPADADPLVVEAAEHVRGYFRRMRDEAEQAGLLSVGPVALQRAEAAAASIDRQLEAVRRRLASAQTEAAEAQAKVRTQAETVYPVAALYRDLGRFVPEFVLKPGQAGKSIRRPVREVLLSVAKGEESEVTDGYARLLALTAHIEKSGDAGELAGLRASALDVGEAWDLGGGWRVRVTGADAENVTLEATNAGAALPVGGGESIDGPSLILRVGRDRVLPAARGSFVELPEKSLLPEFAEAKAAADRASARVVRLRERAERTETRSVEALVAAERMRRAVEAQSWYLPHAYDVGAILADEAGFKAKLVASFRKADSIVDGQRVPDPERPLVPEVAENLGRERLEEATGLAVADLTERDLPPDLLQAYHAELDAYYRRNADSAFEKLTNPKERHGIVDAHEGDPIKARVMEIDEADLAEYLERDLELVMERYHRAIGGRIAVRRAIQLNPELWAKARLADGRPVVSGADLIEYANETVDALHRFALLADKTAGREPGGKGSAVPEIQRLRNRVRSDLALPLEMLEGRTLSQDDGWFAPFSFMGRTLLRASGLNKLGGVVLAQVNDAAPLTWGAMMRPQTTRYIPRAIVGLKGLPERDLRLMGLAFDHVARTRALADIDLLTGRAGFGTGLLRRATATFETGLANLNDLFGRATGMNWITNVNKRVAGVQVIDRVTQLSRRLAAGDTLSGLDAAWLNKMGLNEERARRFVRLVWEHGVTDEDTPIRDLVTFDDFAGGRGLRGAVLKPNADEWNISPLTPEGRANKDLLDVLAANINGAVERGMIVTPGAFDKPLHAQLSIWGRLFQQFQAFQFAFANQRLRPMAQLPAHQQLWYVASYLFLGAVSDAITNHLSGRRSLEETASLWRDNPTGMLYAAWERAGLSGWLSRPLALADAAGVPFSPGNLLGNTVGSTAARHVQPGRALTFFGPAAADVDAIFRVGADVASGRADRRTAYTAARLLPFQNLVWLRLLYRGFGLPVVPEAVGPPRLKREPVP